MSSIEVSNIVDSYNGVSKYYSSYNNKDEDRDVLPIKEDFSSLYNFYIRLLK